MIKYTLYLLLFCFVVNCDSPSVKQLNWDEEYTKQGLVPVDTLNNPIKVELRYSTSNNFVGKDVYGSLEMAYLQPETNEKLTTAAKILDKKYPDLTFVIWDAARPRRIQQVLWDSVDVSAEERPMYVANPETGSIHNFGGALDITLAHKNGSFLDMGTDYDNFTNIAHIDKEQELVTGGLLTELQVQNRQILRSVLEEAGFIPLQSEWWHFDAFSREETKRRFTIIE